MSEPGALVADCPGVALGHTYARVLLTWPAPYDPGSV